MIISVDLVVLKPKPDHLVFPIVELVQSIQETGLRDPIQVYQNGSNDFVLVDGYRRILAYKILGLHTIKAKVIPAPHQESAHANVPTST